MASLKTEVKAIKSLMESQAQEQARANSQPQNEATQLTFGAEVVKDTKRPRMLLELSSETSTIPTVTTLLTEGSPTLTFKILNLELR